MPISNIDNAVLSIMVNDATLKGVVDQDADDVYAIFLNHTQPPPRYPQIYIQSTQAPDEITLDGKVLNIFDAQFDMTCLAESVTDLNSLVDGVRDLFRKYTGTKGNVVIKKTEIMGDANVANLDPLEKQTLWGRTVTVAFRYTIEE